MLFYDKKIHSILFGVNLRGKFRSVLSAGKYSHGLVCLMFLIVLMMCLMCLQDEKFSDPFFGPSHYELQIREKTLASAKLMNSIDKFDAEEKNVRNEPQEEFITVKEEIEEEVGKIEEVAPQEIGQVAVKVSNGVLYVLHSYYS